MSGMRSGSVAKAGTGLVIIVVVVVGKHETQHGNGNVAELKS